MRFFFQIGLLFAVFFSQNPMHLYGQADANFQSGIFVDSLSRKLPYQIYYPEGYKRGQKTHVLLFLHGAGERGTDNQRQLIHGSKILTQRTDLKQCIIIFPQCPEESYWASVDVDREKRPYTLVFDYSKAAPWPQTSAIQLLRKIIEQEGISSKRVHVAGLSMGGMGTFEVVYRYPKLFKTAIPICGGADLKAYATWSGKTRFFVFHGDKDSVVGVNHSREAVFMLKKRNKKVKYTEYAGVDHNSWDFAFLDKIAWRF